MLDRPTRPGACSGIQCVLISSWALQGCARASPALPKFNLCHRCERCRRGIECEPPWRCCSSQSKVSSQARRMTIGRRRRPVRIARLACRSNTLREAVAWEDAPATMGGPRCPKDAIERTSARRSRGTTQHLACSRASMTPKPQALEPCKRRRVTRPHRAATVWRVHPRPAAHLAVARAACS